MIKTPRNEMNVNHLNFFDSSPCELTELNSQFELEFDSF